MRSTGDRLREQDAVRGVVVVLLARLDSTSSDTKLPAAESTRRAVFLFTSPKEGQGTSTVASAVAMALADYGRRTVLAVVDAETGGPQVRGSVLLNDAVEGGDVAFEDHLLTLEVPGNYAELPERHRDPHSWVDRFEIMIIDGPCLKDSLTRYWIPRAEGIVLVLDGEQSSVRAAVQAREDVRRQGGTFVGVVLNRYRNRIPRFIERLFD